MDRHEWIPLLAAGIVLAGLGANRINAQDAPPLGAERLPLPRELKAEADPFPLPDSLLPADGENIDLASTLHLAGVANPEILIARERVVEAVALRQLAAAQLLPNINAGSSIDAHTGTLQQSTGNILKVNRDALYVGLGANAVGAGTVTVPGIFWSGNVSDGIFNVLVNRQRVRRADAESAAVRNDVLLRVATAYVDLLRAEGALAIATKNRSEAREIARITANYSRTGQGRKADADRAATELSRQDDQLLDIQGQVLTASAALAQLLDLDPSVRLHVMDAWVVPVSIVPEPVPLEELLAIAVNQRPELAAQQAAVREAFLTLRGAKLLPFSPNIIYGYSSGDFGGGSNLISQPGGFNGVQGPRFGNFGGRQDVDAVVFWTLQNLGVGNVALIRAAKSRLRSSDLQLVNVLDRVRTEVARAYARTHARFAQIGTSEAAVRTSSEGYHQDLNRIRGGQGLPIEVLDSFRLLVEARFAYLDAICSYNRAQFELYVALGQPPADCLARPVPPELVPPAVPLAPSSGSAPCVNVP
jgi:outer membrane protein TolC